MSEETTSALYDVIRAIEILMSSLTTPEEQVGIEHVHTIAEEPVARARLHLERAAQILGIAAYAYEYIEPFKPSVSSGETTL